MAKKFMYVCFGILALVAAFHLGARYGSASIVDHSTTGVVALYSVNSVLLENGEAWSYRESGWTYSESQLPVAVSEVKFWDHFGLVTQANELWLWRPEGWENCGSPPPLASTQPTTWGEIKAEFGESAITE